MFKLFGGPKSDHPMAELKEARRLLDEVPSGDAFKALDELTHWHESVRTAADFKPDHRTQLVLMIDEVAQSHARKLQRDYLSTTRPSRSSIIIDTRSPACPEIQSETRLI